MSLGSSAVHTFAASLLVLLTMTLTALIRPCRADEGIALAEVRAHASVRDESITAELGDSLFRVLMARKELIYDEMPRNRMSHAYVSLSNPVEATPSSADEMALTVHLDLEQCSYAVPADVDRDIAIYWAFGILGSIAADRDVIAGIVQWRAVVKSPGKDKPLVAIGRGVCAGNPHTLDRRTALWNANRQALWELSKELIVELSSYLGIKAKKRRLSLREEEFKKLTQDW